ncbi:MAG: hypothetical protein SNJ82_07610 [Gemmataceae bacterium]
MIDATAKPEGGERMSNRRNWLEPAVRVYFLCAIGALVAGSLSGVTWLKMIGGFLLGLALLTAVAAGVFLLAVGRVKSASQGPVLPSAAAGEDHESE